MSSGVGVLGMIGVGKSTHVRSHDAALAFPEPVDEPSLKAYIADPKKHAFTFQMGKMHESIGRMWLAAGKAAWVERPPLENVLFGVINYEAGYMSETDYRRYKRRLHEYASNEEQHAMKYVLFHAHENVCWQRLTGRARDSEEKYKDGGKAVFYWERLADGYVRLFLEIALRLQGVLMPSKWKLSLPHVVDWSTFGTHAQVDVALEFPPRVTLYDVREPGMFCMDEYFAMRVEDDMAADWRDRFFRRIAEHGNVGVFLGDMNTIREKCCFYV